jgi:hypothetical protein
MPVVEKVRTEISKILLSFIAKQKNQATEFTTVVIAASKTYTVPVVRCLLLSPGILDQHLVLQCNQDCRLVSQHLLCALHQTPC